MPPIVFGVLVLGCRTNRRPSPNCHGYSWMWNVKAALKDRSAGSATGCAAKAEPESYALASVSRRSSEELGTYALKAVGVALLSLPLRTKSALLAAVNDAGRSNAHDTGSAGLHLADPSLVGTGAHVPVGCARVCQAYRHHRRDDR